MAVYSARGFTAETGTTDPMPVFQLWNPDSTEGITVLEFGLFIANNILNTAQGQEPTILRSTARGTAGSTVTPDADNAWDNLVAPPSGALLDLANFSGNPTRSGPEMIAWNLCGSATGGTAGLGFIWSHPTGIWVPPGQGLLLEANVGGVNQFRASEVYIVWEEEA